MIEKRKQERKYLVAEVKIERADSNVKLDAMAINLSNEGIGLYTDRELRKGEKITVTVTVLADGATRMSEALQGTVRWTQPMGKRFVTGVKFLKKLTKKDFPVLARCLEQAGGE